MLEEPVERHDGVSALLRNLSTAVARHHVTERVQCRFTSIEHLQTQGFVSQGMCDRACVGFPLGVPSLASFNVGHHSSPRHSKGGLSLHRCALPLHVPLGLSLSRQAPHFHHCFICLHRPLLLEPASRLPLPDGALDRHRRISLNAKSLDPHPRLPRALEPLQPGGHAVPLGLRIELGRRQQPCLRLEEHHVRVGAHVQNDHLALVLGRASTP
mmetsp:Transcript_106797/g.309833  ORF Transcript_106797/g.309833 Transcript_106797/m.309833 type:complete len:213 (-) Transcript_106797:1477-2115(-)